MIERAEECRRQLEYIVNDELENEALHLTSDDWKQLSDIKKILAPFNEYTEYISRDKPSIHMAPRLYEELYSMLLAIRERRGDWKNLSAEATILVSDGISLLKRYYDYVKCNDIYYIARILDPRIKTKWLKMLPDGEKIIVRIRDLLKKAYPAEKKPISTALSENYKSLEYRFLGAFQSTQYNISESDIDQYFDTPTISTDFDPNQSRTEFIRNWVEGQQA